MAASTRHEAVLALKRLIYGSRGELYKVGANTLRFVPGTRPVRVKYRNVPDLVTRYDALQTELVESTLRPGDFAIDVGAHAGQYGLIMSSLVGPEGRVISFEPDPHARKLYTKNVALNPAVSAPKVEPVALSNTHGSTILFSKGGNANSSLAPAAIGGLSPDLEQIEIQTDTLDRYLEAANLPAPDLIKIDTEGAEINILEGAASVLRSDAVMICELHPYAWEEFGKSCEDLKSIAAAHGRRIRYLDQDHEIIGEPNYGTVLLERAS